MKYEIEYLAALAEGKQQPTNGFEAHFVRVGRGEAQPASEIELQYWKQVLRHRRETFSRSPMINNNTNEQAIAKVNDELDSLRKELSGSKAKISQQETLIREQSLLIQTRSSEIEIASARNVELETHIEQIVESRLDKKTKEIQHDNVKIAEKNQRISSANSMLIQQLKKFIPPKAKCPTCEGEGTWFDVATTRRFGADGDEQNIRDVCATCNGAGWVENSARAVLKELEGD